MVVETPLEAEWVLCIWSICSVERTTVMTEWLVWRDLLSRRGQYRDMPENHPLRVSSPLQLPIHSIHPRKPPFSENPSRATHTILQQFNCANTNDTRTFNCASRVHSEPLEMTAMLAWNGADEILQENACHTFRLVGCDKRSYVLSFKQNRNRKRKEKKNKPKIVQARRNKHFRPLALLCKNNNVFVLFEIEFRWRCRIESNSSFIFCLFSFGWNGFTPSQLNGTNFDLK